MKLAVYLETSVISYLTVRLSGNLVIAAHQQLTQTWWDNEREKYALHVSQLVIQEAAVGDAEAAANGDAEAAAKRLKVLDNIPLLELTPESLNPLNLSALLFLRVRITSCNLIDLSHYILFSKITKRLTKIN